MNGRSGRPSRATAQDLQSQVGFYLLPPDQQQQERGHHKSSKKKSHHKSRGGSQSRRWASQNQLDVITEASDESRPPSPGGDNRRSRNQGPAWNSSPGRLVRDNTSMPQRGLLGDVAVPGVDMMHHHSRGGGGLSNCRHPQGRMCENLKYGLQQMKYRGQKEAYKAVVEALVIGPEVVRSSEAEDVLGLSSELIHKTRARRGMSVEDDNDTNTSGLDYDPYEMMDNKRGRDAGGGRRGNRGASMSLRELFVHFARYGGGGGGGGNEHGAGQHLSLTQSDKWLKQAGVIDNWNVTTTDTAIAFRKISRGSKYLDYETWKVFLEELAYRKRMDSQGIHEKLLAAGKPQPNQISGGDYPTVPPQRDYHRRSRSHHHQQQYIDY